MSSSPHEYGVWWWEQNADHTFTQHLIDKSFSESHANRLVDLDGDGVPELVTGKRYLSHGTTAPGALDPAVLVYYSLTPDADAGGAVGRERHDIDDSAG